MAVSPDRLRLCIAMPGAHYTPQLPLVLSTLPLLPYLEQWFDITLVFRKLLPGCTPDYPYLTILDPEHLSPEERRNTNGYYTPDNALSAFRYVRQVRRFVEAHHTEFDVVIEKEWPLLGSFSSKCREYGIPATVLTQAEYRYRQPLFPKGGNSVKQLLRAVFTPGYDSLRSSWRQRWFRDLKAVIVETAQMESFLLRERLVPNTIPIVSIAFGIDSTLFFPRDRAACRQRLGIPNDQVVLTYVGSLNRFIQEPAPLIEALGREQPEKVVLHIVGEGQKRAELEAIGHQFNAAVVFHGKVSQKDVAVYMGAADLCVAPYDKSRFQGDDMTVSSLKIPEYLACGRPVLTIPCGRADYLLDRGKYGFMVENAVSDYCRFFRQFPSLEAIRTKEAAVLQDRDSGILDDKNIVTTWEKIANQYRQLLLSMLSDRPLGSLEVPDCSSAVSDL